MIETSHWPFRCQIVSQERLECLIKHFGDIEGIDFIQMGPEDQSRAEIINIIEDKYDDLERQGINIS